MKCPVCKTVDLLMSDRNRIEIDYCPQCRGVWLDRGELDKIIERAGGQYAPSQPQPTSARRDYDDDDYDDDYRYEKPKNAPHNPQQYHHRKKSILGEIFDIFD